jgi:hypothetical protein
MATRKHLVDGGQTLAAQERALNEMELTLFAKVTSYTTSTGTTNNEAVLEDVPIGKQPGPLSLEQAADDTQAATIKAAQEKAGKTLAFQGNALVESKETIVLGFR